METHQLQIIKFAFIVLGLVIFGIFEAFFPLYNDRKNRLKHDSINLSIWVMNIIIIGLLYGTFIFSIYQILNNRINGLLEFTNFNPILNLLIAFLLIDLWMYFLHFLSHKIKFMWNFHQVHHSDKTINTTTGFRFHLGEIFISLILRVFIMPFFGISLLNFLFYEAILVPVLMLQHSNIVFNKSFDKFFRTLFTTPRMHHVHHSSYYKERDSNFGSVLSIWDKLFKTYNNPDNIYKIDYGLSYLKNWHVSSLNSLLGLPFGKKK